MSLKAIHEVSWTVQQNVSRLHRLSLLPVVFCAFPSAIAAIQLPAKEPASYHLTCALVEPYYVFITADMHQFSFIATCALAY